MRAVAKCNVAYAGKVALRSKLTHISLKGGIIMKLKKGFTLVELIIVIAVVALLAVGAIIALAGIQRNARRASRSDEARALANALNYFNASADEVGARMSITAAPLPDPVLDGSGVPAVARTDATLVNAALVGNTVWLHVGNPGSPLGAQNFSVEFSNNARATEIIGFLLPPVPGGMGWRVNTAAIATSS